jgi:hypothetical protein
MVNNCIAGGKVATIKIKEYVVDVFPAGSVRTKEYVYEPLVSSE